uniref:Uncharacterized protein n=1 Tax=Anguilla anguilla TaxID=7936 RepID=A0A0E9U3H1_ANGAN
MDMLLLLTEVPLFLK